MKHGDGSELTPRVKHPERRRILSILLGLVAFACAKPAPTPGGEPAASAQSAAGPTPTSPSAPAEPLKVAFNQWVGFAGMYLADEKALFEKHGLDVKLVPFSGPGDSIPPLLAGQIDLSLTTANNLALIAGKQPTAAKVIYVIDASDGADGIIATAAVKTVADLKGKKVAVTKGEINHMLLMLALKSVNLKDADVSIVDMSPDDAGAAFMAGKVDAAVTWEPWLSRAKERKGHVVYSSKERDAKDSLIDVMAASEKALTERASDLGKFIAAFDEGVTFLKEQPAEAKAILAKRLEAKPEDIDEMLGGARLYGKKENETLLTDSLPTTFGKIESFLQANALVTRPLEPKALISSAVVAP